ncbi:MAG: hypothetical protein BGO88_13425 [Flavobacterium sp. 38-13]|uniref:glycosyltransferase family 2 protein n=1 Tax=Flavobacterium sp. 38-13 TaxID=1896168 RepID=UPI00095CBBBC|nr:glycosyltransferase [Flavobacterium sp. 38-13]OJX52813.1 MAG: hypothetical protein BGO88_13425 [Flavobacterium sp. 38-13]
MELKLSIIIPVYNGEKHIEECIESLTKQTLSDCEFIFVNDGSNDKSVELIQKHLIEDPRIILINQKNSGVSVARNTGIESAKGEYIGFIDSDDFVTNDMFEVLYKEAVKKNADVVVSDYYLGRDGKYVKKKTVFEYGFLYDNESINKKIIPSLITNEDIVLPAVWNKIYRRKFLQDNNFFFLKKFSLEEDILFNIQVISHAKTLFFIDYCGYFYRETVGSASRKIAENSFFDRIIENYNIDIKSLTNITIPYEEVKKFQAVKLVNLSLYYLFKGAIDDQITNKERNLLYKRIILNNDVVFSSKKYKQELLKNKGLLEIVMMFIIRNKLITTAHILGFLLNKIYTPKLSEIFRSLNQKVNVFIK